MYMSFRTGRSEDVQLLLNYETLKLSQAKLN
jgi:hypothetical protein